MEIIILGAGAFGKALAHVMKHKPALVDVQKDGTYSEQSKQKIREADVIFVAIPSQALPKCCEMIKPLLKKKIQIVSCIKALYPGMKTPTQIIFEKLRIKASAIAGPNFAEQIRENVPTMTVLAGNKKLGKLLETKNFHVHLEQDIVGMEYGAAAKNVLALVAGLIKGHLGKNSHNTTGGLVSIAIKELEQKRKIPQLAFYGDVLGSCMGVSRNREFGIKFARCKDREKLMKKLGTIEGLHTIKYLYKTPVIKATYNIIYKNSSIDTLLKCL